jgi:hypothetical protein
MGFFNLLIKSSKYIMPDCQEVVASLIPVFLLVISEGMSLTNKTKYNGLLHALIDLLSKNDPENLEDLEQSITLLN